MELNAYVGWSGSAPIVYLSTTFIVSGLSGRWNDVVLAHRLNYENRRLFDVSQHQTRKSPLSDPESAMSASRRKRK
jgi:hypothetical protein